MKEETFWWSERWTRLIEKAAGKLFPRLRSRARKAFFEFFETGPGEVKGKVGEGTAKPAFAKIYFDILEDAAWAKITVAMSVQAVWEAKLRAGTLPESCETVFAEAGKKLFPEDLLKLRIFCARHGEGVFCFHVAALHFRFAEEFARNPFLLFECLGMPKERLLAGLAVSSGRTAPGSPVQASVPPASKDTAPFAAGPFWTSDGDAAAAAARFRSLLEPRAIDGTPSPFFVRGKNLSELLAAIYKEASLQAGRFLNEKT